MSKQIEKVPSIGCIGSGFIGSSVVNAFIHYTDVKVYDLNPSRSHNNYLDTINQDIVFLCLPSSMNKDGSVDSSVVEAALQKIEDNLSADTIKPVIIKSTLPPTQLGNLMLRYGEKMLLIFNPEFLTERSAQYEYIQSNRFIFGTLRGFSETPEAMLVADLFNHRFPIVPQYWTSFSEASLVKYATNMFFATKLSFMNELAQIAEAWEVDYDHLIGLIMLDSRIGRSHFHTPGHDGKKGWGGSCFYKDMNGYIHMLKESGINPLVTTAAWEKNIEVRGVVTVTEDLNGMLGRAVKEKMSVDDVVKLGK